MRTLVRHYLNQHGFMPRFVEVALICALGSLNGWSGAMASGEPSQPPNSGIPQELKDVGITEHLGELISIQELSFKNEAGEQVPLSRYFESKKPVLLTLVYYECPSLCNYLLNGLLDTLKSFEWSVGKEFEIVTVSIDPDETPELAKRKKAAYLESYGREGASEGWHFLTGSEEQIRKLAGQVGFGYRYDEKDEQYAHSAAIFALTPEGKISRYLYGIQFREKDLKLALLEASNGKVGTAFDRFLLFCYRYDPKTRKYSLYITKIMQAGSLGTVLIFGGYLAVFWNRQRRKEPQGG